MYHAYIKVSRKVYTCIKIVFMDRVVIMPPKNKRGIRVMVFPMQVAHGRQGVVVHYY